MVTVSPALTARGEEVGDPAAAGEPLLGDPKRGGPCCAMDRLSQSSPASGLGVRNPVGSAPAAAAAADMASDGLRSAASDTPPAAPPLCTAASKAVGLDAEADGRPIRVGCPVPWLPEGSPACCSPGRESDRGGAPAAKSDPRRLSPGSPADRRDSSSAAGPRPGDPMLESDMLPPDRRIRTAASLAFSPPAQAH